MDETDRSTLETLLGHRFADPSLLDLALTHASVAETRLRSNERLEFLGDAVLGIIVCDQVFRRYPDLLEGEMTKIKSSVVSRQTCSTIAKQLDLEKYIVLGKGMQSGAQLPPSLGAAALESVIGALYIDGGHAAAERFLLPLVQPLIDSVAGSGHQQNFKSVLQQHAQRSASQTPVYRILDEQGPDHSKCFKICVEIDGHRFEPSWGQSKKRAEQMAALNALKELGVISNDENGEMKMNGDGK